MRGIDADVAPARAQLFVPLVLGTSVVFAGIAYPVTGAALEFTTPALIATTRALAGGLVMLPLLRLAGARLPSTRAGWAWALAIGAGNITLTLGAIAEGTRLAGAAVASVLLNSAPFFAAVLARVLLDERLTRLRMAGLVVGFAGIVVIVATQPSGGGSGHVASGAAVCLAGALGWAAAGLGMRFLSVRNARFDVLGATTAQFLCGGVLLVPYLVATDGAHADWSAPKLWASLVFLVIGAQVITYVGFYLALAHWTSARVFAWTFLVPAVAVVIEALEGDLPSTLTTLGLVIVIAGVAAVTHPRGDVTG